ncbi:hypothetical protein, variant [Aphanomyces invadans]|nr:hypothetical protein, variant [Aphanomyces invadans]ETW02246.1 hypothetical protein, variant [Aphanomyces invadans]|eukprot:XP_008868851.1 hypothetical protein, variant [Aphanomyces invadans]
MPQTSLVFEWFSFVGHGPSYETIYIDGDRFQLLVVPGARRDSLSVWSICMLSRCVDDAVTAPDQAHSYVLDAIQAALPLPHATITGHVSVVAYDIVGRSVLSSVESLSEGPERHLFFQHVARLRGEFAYAQTMHDMLRAKVVDQPHDLVQRVADPLHLNDDHELNTDEGDACLLSSRWSQFRPDPILCHPITQATARVQLNNREFWVIGHRYAAYELFACVDAAAALPLAITELVQIAWDQLVSVQPTAIRGGNAG